MTIDFATAMGRALQQVRAGELKHATRTIQTALSSRSPAEGVEERDGPASPSVDTGHESTARAPKAARDIEDAEIVSDRPAARAGRRDAMPGRRPLREVVDALSRIRTPSAPQRGADPQPALAEGARFERRSFAGPHGARAYRLYVPSTLPEAGRGLVLMLHGCTQTPEDFAAGTRMNEQAERSGLLVVYPHQSREHNAQGCWNWFRPDDQQARAGEPALLAGLVRAIAAEFAVEPDRIFVAGLSAGGAMAATMAATHPDLFAAAGIHSGLAHGSAHDVISAFAAMRGQGRGAPVPEPKPTIVFHGTADATVHPSNADAILAAVTAERPGGTRSRDKGQTPGGRGYVREMLDGGDGRRIAEIWRIDGAGHAWSGGSASGSYTDPAGPDASAEMIRFFLDGRGGSGPAS
ncbi:extracellular catalytic domain type 1 short-chain-length polyhydroxyalkanoate depolymerase [Rhodobacter sp. NSM]|uniref:extracellular catalytic domain type 1 short-chain-length polyhydroxyalkanoate depolymerase n=1 Tax=Rhodobacter sp. NSM TaxID=3457501 RepID=UPI003FD1945F